MADLPCPNCGSPLTFLDQYNRHYCLRCGQYAPEGYGDRGARHCPTCGGILSFVVQYNRYYCYHCNAYPSEETAPAVSPSPAKPETPAAEAGRTPSPTSAPSSPVVITPPTPEPAPVAVEKPPEPLVSPAAIPEGASRPADQPESKPGGGELPPTPAPEPLPPEAPAEPIPQEPSPEIQKLAASKPAIVRVKIFTLKKSELMDLCKAYSLDPSGTKEQVQERLLSYLHDLEAEETTGEEAEAPVLAAPPVVEPVARPAREAEPVAEPAREPITPAATAAASAALVQLEKPEPTPVEEPRVEAAQAVVEAPRAAPKVEHPCPTCGRELTFISQYDRYYCYFCQRYAPAVRAKGACPTCGATMRWIDQHQRWWCDSCQKYAPADLPKPTNGAVAVQRPLAATTSRPAIVIHHHASPAAGIGLIGMGLALWVIYEFFAVLAPAVNLTVNNPFSDGVGAFMLFFAVVFIAGGAMLGLSSARDRL